MCALNKVKGMDDFMDNRILNLNILVLAYLGDCVYENYVRKHLIKLGIAKVNDLQKWLDVQFSR